MFHICHLDSLDRPELAPYWTMRRHMAQREQRIFVAEGDKIVRRLLASNLGVVSALMPEKWVNELAPMLTAREEDIPVFIMSKERLEELTGFSVYQGVLAVGKCPETLPLERVIEETVPPRLLVALDGLANAENLGVVVRNCVAFGVQGLIVGETCSPPYMRRSVRNSMGTIFDLPLVEPTSLVEALGYLRRNGVQCIAAHGDAKGETLAGCDLTGDCCVVFGSEGHGLSSPVLDACERVVAIPMMSGVNSLNVGNAAAVFLYEANRQPGKM